MPAKHLNGIAMENTDGKFGMGHLILIMLSEVLYKRSEVAGGAGYQGEDA